MEDLSRYKPHAEENSVIAWPIDRTWPDEAEDGKRDITFTIKAQFVHETEDGKAHRMVWERLYRAVRRQERKSLRKVREEAAKDLKEGRHLKDEL
jgi:hypothetical protein